MSSSNTARSSSRQSNDNNKLRDGLDADAVLDSAEKKDRGEMCKRGMTTMALVTYPLVMIRIGRISRTHHKRLLKR